MPRKDIECFNGRINVNGTGINLDNTVILIVEEYGITSPKLDRFALKTQDVGYLRRDACTGFYLYDPENRIGALGHVFENYKFYDKFLSLVDNITQCGAEKLIFDYVGLYVVEEVFDAILKAQSYLESDGRLVRPVKRVPVKAIVLDTRDGTLYKPSPTLLGKPKRSYGYGGSDNPWWSRIYPDEFPVNLKSPK